MYAPTLLFQKYLPIYRGVLACRSNSQQRDSEYAVADAAITSKAESIWPETGELRSSMQFAKHFLVFTNVASSSRCMRWPSTATCARDMTHASQIGLQLWFTNLVISIGAINRLEINGSIICGATADMWNARLTAQAKQGFVCESCQVPWKWR
jgi:hypothetical protein